MNVRFWYKADIDYTAHIHLGKADTGIDGRGNERRFIQRRQAIRIGK
jgi:hypothetical protein